MLLFEYEDDVACGGGTTRLLQDGDEADHIIVVEAEAEAEALT